MILDEPTAHLDALTEHVVADTLVELPATARSWSWPTGRPWSSLADHVVHIAGATASAEELPEPSAHVGLGAGRPAGAVGVVPPRPAWSCPRSSARWPRRPGSRSPACSGWLIVQASNRPAVLTLLVAIVGSGPSAWPGRCCATSSGCCPTTPRSACSPSAAPRCTTRWSRSPRAGSGRAAATSSPRSSTTSTACSTASCGAGCPCAGSSSSPSSAASSPALLDLGAGAGGASAACAVGLAAHALVRRGTARAERRMVAARAELSERVVETTQVADELVMWQATRAGGRPRRRGQRRRGRGHRPQRPLARPGARARAGRLAASRSPAMAAGRRPGRRRRQPEPARWPRCSCCCRSPSPRSSCRPSTPPPPRPAPAPRRPGSTRCSRSPRPSPTRRRPSRRPTAPASTVRGVTAGWDGHTALDGLSLDVPAGRRGRRGRPVRLGQEHAGRAAAALRRPRRRHGAPRRRRPPPARARRRTAHGRAGRRRPARLRHHGRREHPPGPARSATDDELDAALRGAGSGAVAGRARGRPRHPARRRRRPGLRRRARAARGGPLAAGRPAGPGPRRAHRPPRPRHRRAAGPPGAGWRRGARGRLDHPRARGPRARSTTSIHLDRPGEVLTRASDGARHTP